MTLEEKAKECGTQYCNISGNSTKKQGEREKKEKEKKEGGRGGGGGREEGNVGERGGKRETERQKDIERDTHTPRQ